MNSEPEEREYKPHYSIKATARELKVSERRVRRALEQGDLRHVWFGGRPLIPGSEVKRLAEAVA